MRILLANGSKKKLFFLLKAKYKVKSIKELSSKLNIPIKTLDGWFYKKERYIPLEIINKEWLAQLKILDKKEDNWGMIKGGKIAFSRAVQKIGIDGVRKRQALGGKKAALTKEQIEKNNFSIDITDNSFLEFYGILLGDGWLSNFSSGDKRVWIIGISTNLKLEKEFVKHYCSIINKKFKRKGTIRERPKNNVSELVFSHKLLLKYLNEELEFPIGKKENLKISPIIYNLGFNKLNYVIRGIFDTDGSFYLDKNRKGIGYYPIISIHMSEPKLIKQIGEILINNGFNINYDEKNNMIKIKGNEQLKKWMKEIGSSNPYKLNKMKMACQ